MPRSTAKPSRKYRLSPFGLASLRSNNQKVRPWERSTGPRTARGKARSSQNARKHGHRSASTIAGLREVRALNKLLSQIFGKPK